MGQDMTVAARRIPNGVAQSAHLAPERPVAGYLRSATELEGDSLRKQLEAVLRYARDRGMQLVRIYCDECRSGLRIDDRPGLRQLFRDIECGAGGFRAVLLLDPSRWRRSPDPEHGLVLEDRCRKFGIEVHYCAEWLDDDKTLESAVVHGLRRYMAKQRARILAARRRDAAGVPTRDNAAKQRGDRAGRPSRGDGGQ